MKSTSFLLEKYLNTNGVDIQVANYIRQLENFNTIEHNINESLFDNIIVDGYNGFAEEVKIVSNFVSDNFKVFFGRKEKTIVKNILDYEHYNLITSIKLESSKNDVLLKLLKNIRNDNYQKLIHCKKIYFQNLKQAISEKNNNRISDYINFLYSKSLIHNEFKLRSVFEIFCENEGEIKKETRVNVFNHFKEVCHNQKTKYDYPIAVEMFNKLYQQEILHKGEDFNEVIGINLDQEIFNSFNSKEEFISYIFNILINVYKELQNHRTLIIKIENIISKDINIKWELYSYLTIYAENFIHYEEYRQYYKPEEICLDFLEHKYSIIPSETLKNTLSNYYKEKVVFTELFELIPNDVSKNEIDFFKKIHNGFQFIDCFILKNEKKYPNSAELDFVENKNELLLVFSKHEIDDRKIPCPVCASLKISGNSYPAVGIKSWECKNDLCSERSKTNRGKRYSSRSNDMQTGVSSENEHNLISKDLISKWRKDIITEESSKSLLEMIIKYFSYQGGRLLFLNFSDNQDNIPNDILNSRKIKFDKLFKLYPINLNSSNTFSKFISGEFISKFIYNNDQKVKGEKINLNTIENFEIVHSNCLSYLRKLPLNSIDHMVTSPPYYNAREYSQWKNLYNYLNDMYKICLASFDVMKPGSVFFYNIGDIFDNPNTIVKSKMGEKRLALGAYLIMLFKSAGFELLDNIVWDKGETQSNRHKNDGNFTPYYQRPANCYEHMFIFKKPGKLSVCAEPLLRENIQKFSPVIKINSKGENLFGHTAPYPSELPLISIKTFTNQGEIVFDPFLGSGTSVYTAVLNGRKGIGTEMDRIYFDLANTYIKTKINQFVQNELF